jgi:hypothetical protein
MLRNVVEITVFVMPSGCLFSLVVVEF